jgi:LPS-assembly lipoprotein
VPNNRARQLLRCAVLLAALGLLAACGFHLRGVGSTTIPDEWKRLHLVTNQPNSEFTRAVMDQFAANGVEWSDVGDANFSLVLTPETFEKRNLSLNAEARVSEFELTMKSQFKVLNASTQEEVIPPTTVSVVKQMENDPRNVVGKEGETSLIQEEMRNELAEQIMRRVGFYAIDIQSRSASS